MNASHKRLFYIAYIMPAALIGGYLVGGIANFATFLWVFGIIPLLDLSMGNDRRNPTEEELEALAADPTWRYVTYFWVPIQLTLVLWGAWVVNHAGLTPLEWIGFTLSMGVITGAAGITIAHELGHKKTKLERFLARALLVMVSYMHWMQEHNKGHHANVATPLDPTTAKRGQTFYQFYPQTVIGTWKHAWHLEKTRLERKGVGVWHYSNEVIQSVVFEVAFAAALIALFGWMSLPYFIVQSIMAFSLLEVVNYLEHYGLERREIEPGKYERVQPIHSWNSNATLTNHFLFMLQRHSDHHTWPSRRYQTLRHFDESPQLPTGYAGMIVLAIFPPLWRKVMDKRLDDWHAARAKAEAA